MGAPRHISPDRLGMVLRIARGAPHRDHAAVPVSPGAIEPPPGMAADRNNPPAQRFGMGNGGFDLLVRMAWSCHSIELPISCMLTFVNTNHVLPLYACRSEERRVGKEVVSTCRSRGWP